MSRKWSLTKKVCAGFLVAEVLLVGSWIVGEKYPMWHTLVAANVYADEIPVSLMEKNEANRPLILKKIAFAESWDSQFCTKAHVKGKMCAKNELGQVLIRRNNNGTEDIGRYQINLYYWGDEAAKLGLNLYDEEDNQAMAEWIYKHHGTQPWHLSKHNWDK